MMFYQLLTVAITLLNFSFKVSGTDDQFPVQHCKKKSPPTSRGSGESTQRFYPNGSQAQAFSIQYPHLDTTSWICLAVGIADTQGGPRIRFRKEVLGGLGGVLRGGFITWNEPRFCFTIPATITRKKKLRIGNPKRKFHHLPTHSSFAGVLAVAFTDDIYFLVCNSTVPLSAKKTITMLGWQHLIDPEVPEIKPNTVPRLSSHRSWQPARPWNDARNRCFDSQRISVSVRHNEASHPLPSEMKCSKPHGLKMILRVLHQHCFKPHRYKCASN